MNFACDKCQKRYSIADEKVRGRTVKIRCKHCQNIISVQGPAEVEVEEEATSMLSTSHLQALKAQDRAFSAQDASRTSRRDPGGSVVADGQWFAMVKGKQVGPFDGQQLQAKVKGSEINLRTYLWKEGMGDWKRANDLPELASIFIGAPPMQVTPLPPPAVAQLSAAPARTSTREIAAAVMELPDSKQEAARSGTPLAELFRDDGPAGKDAPKNGKHANGSSQGVPLGAGPDEATDASPIPAGAAALGKAKPREQPVEDPFAALGELDPSKLPPAGEATSFFIAQAGVNKRNPPWKIAAFVAAVLVVPVVTLYLLSELKVVPLKIKTVDDSGKEVEQSVFSADGVSGLGDLLLGRNKKPVKPASPVRTAEPREERAAGGAAAPAAKDPKEAREAKTPKGGGPSAADLAALYGDAAKKDVGPKVRKGGVEQAKDTATGGLAESEVAKVVGQNQPAFQSCIEQEMRKNPNFKGGKVNIVATVANSGVVTRAEIDRNDIDRSGLGECLKGRAKRMVFSSFAGDETELQIPLILSGTL